MSHSSREGTDHPDADEEDEYRDFKKLLNSSSTANLSEKLIERLIQQKTNEYVKTSNILSKKVLTNYNLFRFLILFFNLLYP